MKEKVYFITVHEVHDGEEVGPKTRIYKNSNEFIKELRIISEQDKKFAEKSGWEGSAKFNSSIVRLNKDEADDSYCLYKPGESSIYNITVCYGYKYVGEPDFIDSLYNDLKNEDGVIEIEDNDIESSEDLADFMLAELQSNIQYDFGCEFSKADAIEFCKAVLARLENNG